MHGATYIVDVEFFAKELNRHNVVIDIAHAKEILANTLAPLAYRNLDEIDEFQGKLTTSEFIARYIHDEILNACGDFFVGRIKVTLGETHDAWASYGSEDSAAGD